MSTIYHQFSPVSAILSATTPAALGFKSGTNFPIQTIDFDASADEQVFFLFRATDYGSGNLTLGIDWYADTGSSGNVVWEAQLACITPDTDTQDIETKAFAALNFVQDTHLGTTAQRLHRAVLTVSNLDALAANDWCVLRLARDANGTSATDDLTGDASLVLLTLSYSDT